MTDSGFDDGGFDYSIAKAWRTFRSELADRIVELQYGRPMIVGGPSKTGTFSPTLIFTATRNNRVRCTLTPFVLPPTVDVDEMRAKGWQVRRDGHLVFEVSRRRADQLSHTAIAAARSIWGVLDPSFLGGSTPGSAPAPVESRPAVGVVPDSQDHLRRLVIDVLQDVTGHPIIVDADGDIPFGHRELTSFLHVFADEAAVEFCTTVIDDVPDVVEAAMFVAQQSARWSGITLVLHQSSLLAIQTLHLGVFQRENLLGGFGRWLDFMDNAVPEIISVLTDGDTLGAEMPHEPLPEALQTLIVLDEDGTTLRAKEVAKICGYDRSAILAYIETSQKQYLSWESSADDAEESGDVEEADACRHEGQAWRATTDKLRDALRVVVLHDRSRADRKPRSKDRSR